MNEVETINCHESLSDLEWLKYSPWVAYILARRNPKSFWIDTGSSIIDSVIVETQNKLGVLKFRK